MLFHSLWCHLFEILFQRKCGKVGNNSSTELVTLIENDYVNDFAKHLADSKERLKTKWALIYIYIYTRETFFLNYRWQFTSICLVLSWTTGFYPIWIATWLSPYIIIGYGWVTSRSFNKANNHVISHTVTPMTLYSASVDDLEIIDCFSDFEEINESPKKM